MKAAVIGKYKIAYWNPTNSEKIKSRMFDSAEKLKSFENTLKDSGCLYTVMTLDSHEGSYYVWQMREEGVGKVFPLITALYQYRYFIGASLVFYMLGRK